MKSLSIAAATVLAAAATVHGVALAQQADPASSCTFTATPCATVGGPIETITVYEQPFLTTSTRSWDCDGCNAVTVSTRECFGHGPEVISTTFVYDNAQSTTTVDVCSPTP